MKKYHQKFLKVAISIVLVNAEDVLLNKAKASLLFKERVRNS